MGINPIFLVEKKWIWCIIIVIDLTYNPQIIHPMSSPKTLPANNEQSHFEYASWFSALKEHIRNVQMQAAFSANSQLIHLYWQIGHEILKQQQKQGWGSKIVDKLAKDLKASFPEMKGFSRSNIMNMRLFASIWDEADILQAPLGQLTWFHHTTLMSKLKDNNLRKEYARLALENGWSGNVLIHHIEMQTAERLGKAQTNFIATLPSPQSDLAQQTLKDPYKLEFLGLSIGVKENRLRQALVDKVADFLLELGTGFAYVGKKVPLEVGGDMFEMDLLFYHLKLHCYIVIELKTGKLKPEHVGQLSFYMSAVDEQVKSQQDNPTIGLLLCKSKNKLVAEYTLRNFSKPIGISSYELTNALPDEMRTALPNEKQLESIPLD